MCAILGILNTKTNDFEAALALQTHRGPDASDVWQDNAITLGHNRLAIIDLHQEANQPMRSASGRYVIVFNGEIYNYKTLREQLANQYPFSSHSDTEVILALIEIYGFENALNKLNGMFALGVWDSQEKYLYLARDKFGEKPLYYGFINKRLAFSSELKSLYRLMPHALDINEEALASYFCYSYISAPNTICRNFYKLEPGKFLKINAKSEIISHRTYWAAIDAAKQHYHLNKTMTSRDACEVLQEKLLHSIKIRQIADVPIGAFLSGGIDSSLIVALMQQLNHNPIKTFTISFAEQNFNEADYARKIASILGTEHTEVELTEKEALSVIPSVSSMYDEPFADSSQIPTYLISSVAKNEVTVALTGDAGDELFAGYNRYIYANKVLKNLKYIPKILRRLFATGVESLLPDSKGRWQKIALLLKECHNNEDFYRLLTGPSQNITDLFINKSTLKHCALPKINFTDNFTEWMMLQDTISYLPGDILCKVDRASMANSLETRIPFLDTEVFDFAWSLPLNMKLRKNKSKWILRELLKQYIPTELIERPKMGFGIPLAKWLRNQLRSWGNDLLNTQKFQQNDILDIKYINKIWQEFQNKRYNNTTLIWNLLVFADWYQHYG